VELCWTLARHRERRWLERGNGGRSGCSGVGHGTRKCGREASVRRSECNLGGDV
jgi:hypothetical protein